MTVCFVVDKALVGTTVVMVTRNSEQLPWLHAVMCWVRVVV